jgi:hypothetical protein
MTVHEMSTMTGFDGRTLYCVCGVPWSRCEEQRNATRSRLRVRPLTLREANAFVARHHRHHKPTQGMKFAIGVYDGDALRGVVIVSRPVARGCDARRVAEVTRLATDGAQNACSILYAAAARAAAGMGYEKIQTYILDSEPGASLRAAGWTKEADVRGRAWKHTAGPRRQDQPTCCKQRWAKAL